MNSTLRVKLLIVHGAGVKFFLDDLTDTPWANDKIDPDLYKRFTGLTKFGVEAYLCEITFKRNNIDLAKAKKDSFLKFVPSGVATIAELQSKASPILRLAEARIVRRCAIEPPRNKGEGDMAGLLAGCGFSTSPMCWPGRSAAINWRSSAPR